MSGPVLSGSDGSQSAQLQREVLRYQVVIMKDNDNVDFKLWREKWGSVKETPQLN